MDADGTQPGDEHERKKEQMRRYIEADRKLERQKEKRRRGGRSLLGLALRLTLLLVVAVGAGYLVWLWHPWSTEIDSYDASERPGACSPGVEGTVTEEHFALLGVRLFQTGGSTICSE